MIATGTAAWYSDKGTPTANWWSTTNFWNYVSGSAPMTTGGIYGSKVTGSVANVQPGDIIQVKVKDPKTLLWNWGHTYEVYRVTAAAGSNTPYTVYICGHTANRQNVTLASAYGTDLTKIRSINIWGIYY